MRRRRTDRELFAASDHVRYEATQFNDCIFRLTTQGLQDKDTRLYNSILTAFTIYARNLHYFFYAQSPRPDDMIASDYFDDLNFWERTRPQETPLLRQTSVRVGKMSAHLTYERLNPQDGYWWIWRDVHQDMEIVLKAFVSMTPSHRLHPALQQFQQDWDWRSKLLSPP